MDNLIKPKQYITTWLDKNRKGYITACLLTNLKNNEYTLVLYAKSKHD